jgi:hypothetical protein
MRRTRHERRWDEERITKRRLLAHFRFDVLDRLPAADAHFHLVRLEALDDPAAAGFDSGQRRSTSAFNIL